MFVQFLFYGVLILAASTIACYLLIGPIIRMSKASDEEIANRKAIQASVNSNHRAQGKVLDMKKYAEGKEEYIVPVSQPQYPIGGNPGLLAKLASLFVYFGGK